VQEDRIPVAQACREVLEFDYDQLGKAIAAQWRIPDEVRECMSDRVLRLRRAPGTDAERLELITHFAHKLTTAVYRREPNGARASVNLLLHSLGPVLNLTHEVVKSIVDRALEETKEVFEAMSVPMDHLRLLRQTEAALELVDVEAPAEAVPEKETESETLASLLRDVTAEVERSSQPDLWAITMMVMEALYRGGPFDHVLFAVLDASGHRLVGKLGFGDSIDRLIKTFDFPVTGASGPVTTAVMKQSDVFIRGPRDRRYDGTRFSQVMGAQMYGLYPLVAGGAVVGCLYFDRRESKNFDAAALAAIGALRDQLCHALMASRRGNLLASPGTSR
jgi:hypothetical protein